MPPVTLRSPRKARRRSPAATSVARAWIKEIRLRVKAVDEGKVIGIPYERLKKEMASRFGL
jgi:hypothetical protein